MSVKTLYCMTYFFRHPAIDYHRLYALTRDTASYYTLYTDSNSPQSAIAGSLSNRKYLLSSQIKLKKQSGTDVARCKENPIYVFP